jgi:hypothetical protein
MADTNNPPPPVQQDVSVSDSPLQAKLDKLFSVALQSGAAPNSLKSVLQIDRSNDLSFKNAYANGSSVIINSDRLILNAKKDYLFVCGKEGVAITSPKSIHIDCDDDLHLFSQTGEIYLGLPNKGDGLPKSQPEPKTKADATKDYEFEPIVLGLKLANLLEDLIVVLRDMVVRTPSGDGYLSTEMMYNLECLQSRLPEMLSTAVFVDGVSHDKVDPAPSTPTEVQDQATVDSKAGDSGNTASGNTTNTTGTTPQKTEAPITPGTENTTQSTTNAINTSNPDGQVK